MVHLCVVPTIKQMDGAWSGGGEADTQLASKLGMSAGHKCAYLPDFPYADYAHSLGLGGIRVEEPEAVAAAWEEALSADRPVVLDMVTNPNVPPLPPHVTVSQMRNYFAALLRHDADAGAIVKASAKEWWAGVSPETADH